MPIFTFKLHPYQERMLKFICSVPDGYEVKFWQGRRRTYTLAVSPCKPILKWNGETWEEWATKLPANPMKMNGVICEGIIFDEFNDMSPHEWEQQYLGEWPTDHK